MIYLESFKFATQENEYSFRFGIDRTCYDSWYPFGILTKNGLKQLDFESVTFLYGGNGSGKTTALNIISEKLSLKRDTVFNRSNFFEDYLEYCDFKTNQTIPRTSRIITSDDVFDFMIYLRYLNNGIDVHREELFEEYFEAKHSDFKMRSLDDYEQLKKVNLARSKTQSQFVRKRLMDNTREHSNGESAFLYFADKINENALYLLDEPENSLSPDKQLELLRFIEDSARFWNCQFVIATHSPFLLSIKGAKIYDFDETPVDVKKWTELKNVRIYRDFFKDHEDEFMMMEVCAHD